jgi:glucose/arabinose dehydrogenase
MRNVERRNTLLNRNTHTQSKRRGWLARAAIAVGILAPMSGGESVRAQGAAPTMLHPNLAVRTVVTGLTEPTTMAFIGWNDFLVLEKSTGKVQRVVKGAVQSTVLDLAVNFGSERGLLGIALHPDFPRDPAVYLYWTESTTGADTDDLALTPLLGNRVDRFEWDGSTLTHERNLIRLRAIQQDATNPAPRGNHDGGVLAFQRIDRARNKGDDRVTLSDEQGAPENARRKAKLLIFVGDLGRRGQLQNLREGPFGPGTPDDEFGGPEPDEAHLSGVVLRLNDDGSTPEDNPFFAFGATLGGEVGATLQKVFAFGFRNGFGIAVDPRSGDLWTQENGDDSFSEINRVEPGTNGGWAQVMGPIARITQFKATETSPEFLGLQQVRWSPSSLADTPGEALTRLFVLPESKYSDPEFSWRFEVAPGGIGFVNSRGLGREFEGDLFVGAARPTLLGGYLFRFKLSDDRKTFALADPRLADRVADNLTKFEATESDSLLVGMNFGIGTDVETGPNGNVFVVSLSNGAIYEIYRRR